MRSACTQCGEKFGWNKPTMVAWIDKEHYAFCSSKCRQEFLYPKRTNRICSREVCNNRVQETSRMLCPSCYQKGNHLGETEVSLSVKERAHWDWMQYALLRRIEKLVKVYSSQNMTQEELRSLVPSLKGEEA